MSNTSVKVALVFLVVLTSPTASLRKPEVAEAGEEAQLQ